MPARTNRSSKVAPTRGKGRRAAERPTSSPERGRLAKRLAVEQEARRAAEAECARLRADLGALAADRDDFLAAAAHDLRTPLTALGLQVQGLIAYPQRNTGERLTKRLHAMDRQIRHMDALVSRVLGVAQISGGQLRLTPVTADLAAIARDVAQRFEPELAWARCALTIRADAPVVGVWDALRIEQVIGNLLANAIKYGAGAPIEIEVAADAKHAQVRVRDHGIGIAPEEHERIFTRFVRAEGVHAYKGLGLGLWIVRQIVEASGGSVSVVSRPGAGATFAVDLPREAPSA